MPDSRRKTKVSYDIPGHAHFVTFSCFNQLPLLSRDRSRRRLIDALEEMRKLHNVAIWAYVVMPEHVHLLLRPRNPIYRMRDILAAIKRPVSVNAKSFLIERSETAWLNRLTVRKGDKSVFRFWLPGGGFDENITEPADILRIIEYIHTNPVRRGLVERAEDWIWSSARYSAGHRDVPLLMDPLEL
jgi:REP-associated tyrosine transposase